MHNPLIFLLKRLSTSPGVVLRLILIVMTLITAGCNPTVDAGENPQIVESPPAPVQFTPAAIATSAPTATAQPAPIELPASPTPGEPTPTPLPDLSANELPVSDITYLLPLTIRHLEADQAVLFFELSEPGEGYLLYQEILPGRLETRSVPITAGETRQQIILDGLTPGAEYLAGVALQDGQGNLQQPAFLGALWGNLQFRVPSADVPLRVGVIGDASFGDPATTALVEQMTAANLDFVIHTGDVVYDVQENNGPFEAYALKYYQPMAPLLHRLPIYTVNGNHDYDAAARWGDSYFYYYAFPRFPTPQLGEASLEEKNQYYAFASHGIQFLMLDSQVIFGVDGREAQKAWMAERLADPRFRYTIPVFHVPPFFSASVHPEDQLPVRSSWHPLFSAARVPLALSGHSHHYERLAAGGVTYIVSGGGSGTLYAAGEILPESQLFARRTHFVLLEIYPDRIELAAIDKDGALFDQAVVLLP